MRNIIQIRHFSIQIASRNQYRWPPNTKRIDHIWHLAKVSDYKIYNKQSISLEITRTLIFVERKRSSKTKYAETAYFSIAISLMYQYRSPKLHRHANGKITSKSWCSANVTTLHLRTGNGSIEQGN